MPAEQDISLLFNLINSFVPLTQQDKEHLIPHLSYRNVKKGDYWLAEGEKEQQVGFILEGSMRHFYLHDGEEKTTYFYFENNLVSSYFSALTGTPSKLSIQAMSNCRLISFPYKVLVLMYELSPKWERFGRKLAEYLVIGLEERMVELLVLSPEERYNRLFNSNKKKILERMPQHLIANYLGITPVSLSRIRKRAGTKK